MMERASEFFQDASSNIIEVPFPVVWNPPHSKHAFLMVDSPFHGLGVVRVVEPRSKFSIADSTMQSFMLSVRMPDFRHREISFG
jgi:hypothetical protein